MSCSAGHFWFIFKDIYPEIPNVLGGPVVKEVAHGLRLRQGSWRSCQHQRTRVKKVIHDGSYSWWLKTNEKSIDTNLGPSGSDYVRRFLNANRRWGAEHVVFNSLQQGASFIYVKGTSFALRNGILLLGPRRGKSAIVLLPPSYFLLMSDFHLIVYPPMLLLRYS